MTLRDEAILQWLSERRQEFGGAPPKALLDRGDVQQVEAALIELWNSIQTL